MQRFHRRALALMAVSLTACQATPSLVPGLGSGSSRPGSVASGVAGTPAVGAPRSDVEAPRALGHSMVLSIRWPARRTQGVLAETDLLEIETVEYVQGQARPGRKLEIPRKDTGASTQEFILTFDPEVNEAEVKVQAFAHDPIKGKILKGSGVGSERLRKDTTVALRITLSAAGGPSVITDTQQTVLRNLEGWYAREFAYLMNPSETPEGAAYRVAIEDLWSSILHGLEPARQEPPAPPGEVVVDPGQPVIASRALGGLLQIFNGVPGAPLPGQEPPDQGPASGSVGPFPALPVPLVGYPIEGLKNHPDTRIVIDPGSTELRGIDLPGYMPRIKGGRQNLAIGGEAGFFLLDLNPGFEPVLRPGSLAGHFDFTLASARWKETGSGRPYGIPGSTASYRVPILESAPDLSGTRSLESHFWLFPTSLPDARVGYSLDLRRFAALPAEVGQFLPRGMFAGFSLDGLRVPLEASGSIFSPWASIEGQTRISIDDSVAYSGGKLTLRDASRKPHAFPYDVKTDWSTANLRTGEGLRLFAHVDDLANEMGLRIYLEGRDPSQGGPRLEVVLVDPRDEHRLGVVEFPLEQPERGQPPRLKDYPVLRLEPLAPGEDPLVYRLTPGFFSGDRTGALLVEVR